MDICGACDMLWSKKDNVLQGSPLVIACHRSGQGSEKPTFLPSTFIINETFIKNVYKHLKCWNVETFIKNCLPLL